jgi:type I restriction enzyme, S subunit
MELKSGYKQMEVGVIPEDWDVVEASALGPFITSGSRGWAKYYSDRGALFMRMTNLSRESIYPDLSDHKLVDLPQNETEGLRTALQDGDILISITADIGIIGYVNARIPKPTYINQHIACLRLPPKQADSLFQSYYLASYGPQRRFAELTDVGAKTGINLTTVGKLKLLRPPLPEQHAIAKALSDADALLTELDRLIAKKRDLKQAAMQQLLTGQTRIPGFQGKWEVKRFGELAIPRKDRVDPGRTAVHEFCVELEHIEPGTGKLLGNTSTGENSSLKSVFREGDVLFGKLRAYLRKYWLATKPGVCSTEIWVFAPNIDLVTAAYLYQLVKIDQFIDVASTAYGTHMPRSDWNVVKNYELRVPNTPEQTAIAEVLTDMDAELAALEQQREKTQALKQAMMQELLTGKTRFV